MFSLSGVDAAAAPALVSCRLGAEEVTAPVSWVGIVGSGPATLTVAFQASWRFEQGGPEGEFVVQLPERAVSFGRNGARLGALPPCPLRIACRNGRWSTRFGRSFLRGEIVAMEEGASRKPAATFAQVLSRWLFASPAGGHPA